MCDTPTVLGCETCQNVLVDQPDSVCWTCQWNPNAKGRTTKPTTPTAPKCKATLADGSRCLRYPDTGTEYCHAHRCKAKLAPSGTQCPKMAGEYGGCRDHEFLAMAAHGYRAARGCIPVGLDSTRSCKVMFADGSSCPNSPRIDSDYCPAHGWRDLVGCLPVAPGALPSEEAVARLRGRGEWSDIFEDVRSKLDQWKRDGHTEEELAFRWMGAIDQAIDGVDALPRDSLLMLGAAVFATIVCLERTGGNA
jgi:hypothetical protein